MKTVTLKPGREKLPLLRHPWIYANAVDSHDNDIAPGEIVRVVTGKDGFIAYGSFNKNSQIIVRLMEWDAAKTVDESWISEKLRASCARRSNLASVTDAVRLVHAESDLLPGLIIDRYNDMVTVGFHTAGMNRFRGIIIRELTDLYTPEGIYERVDTHAAKAEGLTLEEKTLFGTVKETEITEHGKKYSVDVVTGQKTGFYIDQRDNRHIVAEYVSGDVFDGFCYTGGFTVHAAPHATSVTSVDSSGDALDRMRINCEKNGCTGNVSAIEADVFDYLRKSAEDGKMFDTIILDPPKLAPTRQAAPKALRAYKDMHLFAMKCLKPNGILASFSCSGGVPRDDFRTTIAWGAKDAKRDVQVLRVLSQAEDHPVRLSFPEAEYLKGFICRVI
ncbi:MAG: class I SAM-dependent rRNA methyltransferase [Spirochaetes bacterium]|nr:class I SAM-dependent rRNA methyltransferase [Spirochaetota bacterium]